MVVSIEAKIARILLDIKAVALSPSDPFVWTSGLKSPIYCDNRLIMSYPKERLIVEQAFVALINERFPDVDVIAGTATAGIPHASMIAQLMNKPMIYVRSDAKKHGKKNAIEGVIEKGQKVLMIEDLISTGKSVIQAANFVNDAGGKVIGCCAIFNYLLPIGQVAFSKVNYPLFTLTNYDVLVQEAVRSDELKEFKDILASWRKDPVTWSNERA